MFARASLYNHQKVVLEIDFSGLLFGYTEITVVPTSKELKTIYLHSRQCTVTAVQVGGYSVQDWAYLDPLSNVLASEITDCHRHPELKRRLYSSYAECDEGELAIPIPRQVAVRSTGTSTGGVMRDTATPEPHTPAHTGAQQPILGTEFSPIQVRITYHVRNPAEGIQFVLPNDAYPYRVPHVYTTPSSPDAARCWVPCLDNLWEKCTWELEFIVPKSLEDDADAMEIEREEGASEGTDHPTVVVCSGELVEKIAHPNNPNKVIFLFSQPILTSVQHIAFAAGPFVVYPVPTEVAGLTEESAGSQAIMHAFCLPGYDTFLSTTVSFLRSAMNFYSTEFGSYPFGSYKLVFVDELPDQRFDSATLTITSTDLLHGEDMIDQVFETRQVLLHSLACQWAGINIIPKTWSDVWLVNGLGLYITGLCLRKLFGNNEYRFRLRKDMDRVLELDNGQMAPICQPGNLEPPDSAHLAFINLKAPLILHILDRKLGKSGTSLGLSRVLPKVFLSAISGEMQQNSLSTHSFLRTCRKVSGADLRSFVDQWIYGSGCPQFSFIATFNRKRMAVEIQMRQECPAHAFNQNNPIAMSVLRPMPFFEGQMTVRIHEADGTPYEHVLDILSTTKRFEVPFNTKYKRVRRNTKRYLARQAAAQAAAEGDMEAAEAIGMIDMGFGLEVWENEDERERWKVADWTEEEEQAMAGATYEWIRMDADFEWIARIQFEQPDYMWVSQLQRDRDVVAQVEAVHALARLPTHIVSSTLTRTVLVTNYFFRVRCEAALALVKCATRRLDFIGLFHLFKLFLRYCYDPDDPSQDLFSHKYVPRPNDFSDLAEYFVRKALLNAISQVRFENGKTPPLIRQFFVDQLRYNDNTTNSYSDAYYIATLISSLACATVSTAPPERGELTRSEPRIDQTDEDKQLLQLAISEVERYRSMDRLIPSVHNVVTVAALEFQMILMLANLTASDPKVFLTSTREGNATQVRLAGFDGLFLTKWYVAPIMQYILAIVSNDPSRIVRRHVARNICESLALLATIGEIKHTSKDNETLLIEEDSSMPEKMKENKKTDVDLVIRALRKDKEIGRSDVLREFVMPIILDPDADYEVRWCMLKLADLAVRGVEEPTPKVTIHLPPTPVFEAAPPLPPFPAPSIKIAPKGPKPQLKVGGRKPSLVPSTPTSAASTPTSTKLRLIPPGVAPATTPVSADTEVAAPKQEPEFKPPPPPVLKLAPAPPKRKERPLERAQASGISLTELRACRTALKRLKSCKHAVIFQQPVDPVRDRAPNYFEVVKHPMDLSSMTVNLEEGRYKNRNEFEADFRLMIKNCQTYNPTGTYAYNESIALTNFFEKQWARIINTLDNVEKTAQQLAPAPVPQQAEAAPPTLVQPRKVDAGGPSKRTSTSTPIPAPPAPAPPPQQPPSTQKAPTILKLKLGSARPTPPASAESSKPSTKPPAPSKPKKHKAVDMPPPPYIDDGSHDLLQEVIAMEELERIEKSPTKGSSSKQRRVVELDPEEELLNLAVADPEPLYQKHVDVPKGPTLVPAPAPAPSPPLPPPPVPVPVRAPSPPKPVAPPLKPKKPVEKPLQPSPSAKGKEKEGSSGPMPPHVTAPSKPRKSSTPSSTTPVNERKCREVLKNIMKLPQAIIFARPVDPILDGCPTYYDEIKNPMDFGTMKTKLDEGHYSTMEEFASDVHLILANCRQFNPPTTGPTLCADAVEKLFRKEWVKAMEKKLSFQEKRSIMAILNKLAHESEWFVFREPVDPVALGIPTYFDVVPRKDARDLRTIRSKLETDKYDSIDAWEADMELMIRNAITFNGPESEVGRIAVRLRGRVKEDVAKLKSSQSQQGKKRAAGGEVKGTVTVGSAAGAGSGQQSKKIKLA